MLIYEGNLHKKIGAISQLGTEKITFPPKSDRHTDIHQTDRRTDIREALLIKKNILLALQFMNIISYCIKKKLHFYIGDVYFH